MAIESLGYLGNVNVKKDGVQQEYTEQEQREYIRCRKDPAYFAEHYAKVVHLDKGLVPFKLYPYQKKMFEHFNDNRFSIVLACRQSGKSISSCIYILWYAIFHSNKTIAILANKGDTAREMLSRILLALENLPFFLQPGARALNKGSMEFSNNTKIVARATSSSSIRGMSINLLFLDEFAFIENDATFYTSTYPVIISGTSTQVIITSTANGIGNTYHKLWTGAVQGVNSYKPFRIDWHDVPGRDEKWRDETIANTSLLQFKQEFGNDFLGNGDTLIEGEHLLKMSAREPLYDKGSTRVYKEPNKSHSYIMAVDVAQGRGQDYSTFNIIDVSTRPFEQVAVYRNNKISPILFPAELIKWAKVYNNAYMVVENNDQGALVTNGLHYDFEWEEMYHESTVQGGRLGLRMTRKSKKVGCSNLKDLIEENKLEIVDEETIKELSTFEARGTSFEASRGNHDDMVMSLVAFAWFTTEINFLDLTDTDVKSMMYAEKMRQINDDHVPFGFVDDGIIDDNQPTYEKMGGQMWAVDKDDSW